MGTYGSAVVWTTDDVVAEQILAGVRDAYEQVDGSMSNWDEASDLSRLNLLARQGPVKVEDRELFRCIRIAMRYARATRGAFDPTVGPLMQLYGFRPHGPQVPSEEALAEALEHVGWDKVEVIEVANSIRFRDPEVELDLGGIAKGCALDVAARMFSHVGCRAGLLDLGGNLYAWNRPPEQPAWTVGIRHPDDTERLIGTLQLANRGVATSSNRLNSFTAGDTTYGHIMAAATGQPAVSDVIQATVIADSATDADALATAMIVAGSKRAAEWLERATRVEAVLLVEGREGPFLLASTSLRDVLQIEPGFLQEVGGTIRFLLPPEQLGLTNLEGSAFRQNLLE